MGTYRIHEIFLSLQGEGIQSGRTAIFCRFAGCNLWSGHESARSQALCSWCDTIFVGEPGPLGGRYHSNQLCDAILSLWPNTTELPYVVLTGGEPLMQLDSDLVDALHDRQAIVALETNGTLDLPCPVDWLCVSPKARTTLRLTRGNELKLVLPQGDLQPTQFEAFAFDHFLFQPRDDDQRAENTRAAIDYCRAHPHWRLSLQLHKLCGIP